jgi:hypothetical protein
MGRKTKTQKYTIPTSVTEQQVQVLHTLNRVRITLGLNYTEFIILHMALVMTTTEMKVEDRTRLNTGQLLCSLQDLAAATGLRKSQVRTLFAKLKANNMVRAVQLSRNRGQLITWLGKLGELFERRLSIITTIIEGDGNHD